MLEKSWCKILCGGIVQIFFWFFSKYFLLVVATVKYCMTVFKLKSKESHINQIILQ